VHQLQVRRVHKDTTRFASSVKTDDAAPMEPAKTPDVDAPAAATNAAQAK
jgi:hypothetical protein